MLVAHGVYMVQGYKILSGHEDIIGDGCYSHKTIAKECVGGDR